MLKLHIAHLYGDLMNTYSDIGNILVLKYFGKRIGVEISSEIVSINQPFNPSKFDLIIFGGGQDYEQSVIAKDILKKKGELTTFIENNAPVLAICGGYQLLGKYYIGANGEKIKGISALPHYTLSQKNNRFTGDIVIENEQSKETYRGFENHNGVTFLGDGEKPLGNVISGFGNNGKDKTEGAIYKKTYCTYFHGPILARNHNLAKRILLDALYYKYPDFDSTKLGKLNIKNSSF